MYTESQKPNIYSGWWMRFEIIVKLETIFKMLLDANQSPYA